MRKDLDILVADVQAGKKELEPSYCIHLIDRKEWPSPPKDVSSETDMENNVEFLSDQVETILQRFVHPSICQIEFKIGKTSVMWNKTHAEFSSENFLSWRYGDTRDMSPAARWAAYKKDNYYCLVAFMCLGRTDLPDVLKANKIHQQQLTLTYEKEIDERMKTKLKSMSNKHLFKMVMGDPGGGGRATTKAYAGGIVYLAVKLHRISFVASRPTTAAPTSHLQRSLSLSIQTRKALTLLDQKHTIASSRPTSVLHHRDLKENKETKSDAKLKSDLHPTFVYSNVGSSESKENKPKTKVHHKSTHSKPTRFEIKSLSDARRPEPSKYRYRK